MRSNPINLVITALACMILFSCTKKTESYTTAVLSDYFPLQVGKYITYRLDSTVFTSFGTVTEVHSYQEKQIVDAQITDALGRNSYRILRFTSDTIGTQPWAPAGSYFITPTDQTMEVIDNNLRFLKLVKPIKQNFTWKGNRYLPDNAFDPLYSFTVVDVGMSDWQYTYSTVGESTTIKGQKYDSVVTVDFVTDNPFFNTNFNPDVNKTNVINPNVIAYVSYLQEKYSKGIGLISQLFVMWEYQPPNGSNSAGSKVGFGVKRLIIDHN